MQWIQKLLLLSFLPLAACSSLKFSGNRGLSSTDEFSVPVADWAGVLQLPTAEERRPDGGVWLQVNEAPEGYENFKGQKIWLKWDETDPGRAEAFRARFIDVQFCDLALRKLQEPEPRTVLRERVNGWSKVSPLESLAAAHAVDDMRVAFAADQIIASSSGTPLLQTKVEPLIVGGNRETIAKFKRQISAEEFIAETMTATPVEFTVQLNMRANLAIQQGFAIDTAQFLLSAVNQGGWIMQGVPKDGGGLVVDSIAPYQAYTLSGYQQIADRKDFRKNKVWELDLNKGRVQKIMATPHDFSFAEGDEFLLFDAYGTFDRLDTVLGMSPGHAAIGQAKIVRHRLTGELLLRTNYWQIYYDNIKGIIAGRYDTVAFNGDLQQGKQYFRTISDVMIPISFLNGRSQMWDLYGKNTFTSGMEKMVHNIRVGFGKGINSSVMITNCVHDSATVLIETVNNILANGDKSDPVYQTYRKERRYLGPNTRVPPSLRSCNLTHVRGMFQAFSNGKTIMPRRFQDAAVKGFMEGGAPAIDVKTILITQDARDYKPVAPFPIVLGDLIFHLLWSPFTSEF